VLLLDKAAGSKISNKSESLSNTSNNHIKGDEFEKSNRNPSHNLEGETIQNGNGSTIKANSTVVLQKLTTEKRKKNKLSTRSNNQQLKQASVSHSDNIPTMPNEKDQVRIGEKRAHTETLEKAGGGMSDTPDTDDANQYKRNKLSSSYIQSTEDEIGEEAAKKKPLKEKIEKKQNARGDTEDNADNATNRGRKVKNGKVKKKPSNHSDPAKTKNKKKRKSKEQTVVDCVEEVQVTNGISQSDVFSPEEDFCEINFVNEHQPTAVQAWACTSEPNEKDDNFLSDECESLLVYPGLLTSAVKNLVIFTLDKKYLYL
jgi:hypothetical protein